MELKSDDLKDIGTLFGVTDPDAINYIIKIVLDSDVYYPFRIFFERSLLLNPYYKTQSPSSPLPPVPIYSPITSLIIEMLLYNQADFIRRSFSGL